MLRFIAIVYLFVFGIPQALAEERLAILEFRNIGKAMSSTEIGYIAEAFRDLGAKIGRSGLSSQIKPPHDDPRPVTPELLRLMSLPHSPALVIKAQACQMPQPNRAPIKGDAPSLHPAIKSSQSI